MASTEKVILEMLLKNEKFKKEVAKSVSKIKGVETQTKKVSKSSGGFLKKIRAGWIAVAAAVTLLSRALLRLGKSAIAASAENESAQLKFQKVFRGSIEVAEEARRELTSAFALSGTEATKLLSAVQDILVPMGLMRDEAAKVSGNVVKLASDIAVFNEKPTAEVMNAIQSAMVGMNRPMLNYGVSLTAAAVRQEALNLKLIKGKEELTAAARAQAALSLITQSSTDAIGSMTRQWDTWAVVTKRVKAAGDDITNLLGDELVKALGPSLKLFADWVGEEENVNKLRTAFQNLGAFIKASADSTVALVAAFVRMGNAIRTIANEITSAGEKSDEALTEVQKKQAIARVITLKLELKDKQKEEADFLEIRSKLWDRSEENIRRLQELTGRETLFGQQRELTRLRSNFVIRRSDIGAMIREIALLESQLSKEVLEIVAKTVGGQKEAQEQRVEDVVATNAKLGEIDAEGEAAKKTAAELAAEKAIDDRNRRLADAETEWDRVQALNDDRRKQEEAKEEAFRRRLAATALRFANQSLSLAKTFAEQEAAAKVALIQSQVAAGVISEEQGQKQIGRARVKAFQQAQKIAIAEAVIKGATAILSISAAWAAVPPVAAALSIASLAITAAQIALIARQSAPAFQEGGIAGLGGPQTVVVGERGPEAVLPAGLTDLLLNAASGDTSNNLNLGEGSIVLNFSGPTAGDPEAIKEVVIEALAEASDDLGRETPLRG